MTTWLVMWGVIMVTMAILGAAHWICDTIVVCNNSRLMAVSNAQHSTIVKE